MHILFSQYQILKAQERINNDEQTSLFCNQQAHIVISIFLSYTIYYTFHRVLLHSSFHISLFCYRSYLKEGAIPSSDSSLFQKTSTIGHLNVQVAASKNEERYILSNIL